MLLTLEHHPLSSVLDDLYGKSRAQRSANPPRAPQPDVPLPSAQQRADEASDRYMPVSAKSGRLLYSLVRAVRPTTVVEFGMSYGISTLHLAAAVRDNGVGQVYTTELSARKLAVAAETFVAAGVDDLITILSGDALETLKTVTGEIGIVFLDGWKELYLPVLRLIEPQLRHGALILADNANTAGVGTYLDYVRDPANGYYSINFPDKEHNTTELSCRV
jgi:predicted O-methyltransferase YrrM